MMTAVLYWFLKFQFGKDWNLCIMVLPIVWDVLATATWLLWLTKW